MMTCVSAPLLLLHEPFFIHLEGLQHVLVLFFLLLVFLHLFLQLALKQGQLRVGHLGKKRDANDAEMSLGLRYSQCD